MSTKRDEQELRLAQLRVMKADIASDIARRPRTQSLAVELRKELREVRQAKIRGSTTELETREHELCRDLALLKLR